MDMAFSDFTSPIVEFTPVNWQQKLEKLIDNSTGTDPLPAKQDNATASTEKFEAGTQTELQIAESLQVDDRKLAKWLQKVYPTMEKELLKGLTPIPDNYLSDMQLHSSWDDAKVQTYQKLTLGSEDNYQVLATWLAVHTNNAPALVLSAIASHDNWCGHVNQQIRLYVPKRVHTGGSFVVFSEVKAMPIKACLRSLCTNSYNKNIFAGSSMNGDLYVWEFVQNTNSIALDIKELSVSSCEHGFALAMDWCSEQRLLTCHTNGVIMQWLLGKQQLLLESEVSIKLSLTSSPGSLMEITCLLCLNANDFIVGTKDGSIYHCWNHRFSAAKKTVETTTLRKHAFMVSTLLKVKIAGRLMVISCDLSGQVYYHDMRTADNDTVNLSVQTPLPFKNAIACSRDGNIIFCPGIDGSLECYRINDGAYSVIKGALRGRANFIKASDNGCWLLTGLYGNELQLFYVED